jgi:hypothetical protein
MRDQPPGRIMIAWYQLRNSDALSHEDDIGKAIRQLWNKLRRSASVTRQPVDHPGVGGGVVSLPRTAVMIRFPMSMSEASGVLVDRIASVGVLEGRLRKRQQQAGRNAEMDQPTYQATLLYLSSGCGRDLAAVQRSGDSWFL